MERGFIYWTPRVLSLAILLLVFTSSFDVFGMGSFWMVVVAFLMHNIPTAVLGVVIYFAWRHELVGAIAFLVAAIAYVVSMVWTAERFEWYLLAYAVQFGGLMLFIAVMYYIGFRRSSYTRGPIRPRR